MRSLTYFNKIKLSQEDKDFSDNKTRVSKGLVKKNSHFIHNKPRNLRYSFVTDIFRENANQGSNDKHHHHRHHHHQHNNNENTFIKSDIGLNRAPSINDSEETASLDNELISDSSNSYINVKIFE